MNYLGIRGFESILRGGIPARADVLLLTPEGPERHLLGSLWVLEGLGRGERVLAVLSGESPDAFLARLGRMGVDAASTVASGSLTIVDWFSCWTQPVEGVEEVHRMLRASRKVEDLLAAVDRAVPVLAPAPNKRAFVDVLPLAFKALDEAGASQALRALRVKLSEAGVTAVFAADRALPEARRTALFPTFHAVLDARSEERDVLAFAVLAVGGVKLKGRYRRARVREDGAAVEATRTVRTFSCPICDARVPFDAEKCPSCGSLRAEMSVRPREEGLMDYVETLGREGGVPGARPRPARETRAPGLTNGVRAPKPGRVNGVAPGRVNGTAAKGRTNGVAPAGRTNGLQAGPGRTNGLVNGLARARSGMTNGLTNGSGFTNGLGGPRALREAHRARWKLYLVPLLGALLLATAFILPGSDSPARFSADGEFDDWAGVPVYEQDPAPGTNPAIALTAYRIAVDVDQLALRATVAGTWFDDPDVVHALCAFVDADRDPATGYAVQGWGADYLVSVEGSGGTVSGASVREFTGSDPLNWSAWASVGSASAAAAGRDLEVVVPWGGGQPTDPVVILFADDGAGARSYSAVAFGKVPGALRAQVRERSGVAARGTPVVLDVVLEAFGGPVTVEDVEFGVTGATVESLGLPVTVSTAGPTTLPVSLNTGSAATGDLLTVVLRGVVTDDDHPVLLGDRVVRAYVESGPVGKDVDGWFWDWSSRITNDSKPTTDPADLDLVGYSANRTGTELFLYGDVRGSLFAGVPAPVHRSRPVPGGEPQQTTPLAPTRTVGEDVFRAYVDVDRDEPDGVPALGLRGADLLLEVRGIHGEVTRRTAYEWRNGWQVILQPEVATDAHRLEASLPVPANGAVEVAFETRGWHGPGDSIPVSGTRGVRPDGGGYRSDGRVTAAFGPTGRVELSAGGATLAWTLPSPPSGGWSLAPTEVGVTYSAPGVEVRYEAQEWRLKEDFVFLEPPANDVLEFPYELGGSGLLWSEEGVPPEVRTGSRRVFAFEAPYAVDAHGRVTPMTLEADTAIRTLRIPLPADLVFGAAYPLTVDPVTSYTLENDGDANDPGEQLGYSTAIGDFNGDGYADVLTGAPNNNKDNTSLTTGHGYAYIWYGPFSAGDTSPDVWFSPGNLNSTRFGFSVAAGRFNNDNYWDALIARVSINTLNAIGNVTIFYGASGLSGLKTTPDVEFIPPQVPRNYGWSVAAGDLDGANYDDVVISEPGRDLNADTTADGAVYVFKSPFGSQEPVADYRLVPSSNSGGQLGYVIAVGKIDSDAYADVVVGESVYSSNVGRVQFYKGSHFTSGSGDVSPDATIDAPSAGGSGQFGFAVAVGTLNGDAYDDLLVGAPNKFSADGRAYVFPANSDGSGLTTGASPTVTLTNQAATERFGYSVLIADWSDDGTNGVVVGAPTAPAGGTNRGSAYWFNDPLNNQVVDETVSGLQDTEWLARSLAGRRFSNDAYTVVAIGAYLWNDGADADSGRVVVATVPEPLTALLVPALALPPLWRRLRLRRRGVIRQH